jgi:site-specific DNA recombinase
LLSERESAWGVPVSQESGPQARRNGDGNSPRAVGYIRYSTDAQDRSNGQADEAWDSQLDEIQAYARRQGYDLDDVYKDVITGQRADRMEYTSLLDRISTNTDVDVLVTTEISRIGRDGGVAGAYLVSKARAVGVTVETTTGSEYDFDRPEDKLRFRILQAVAEYEVDLIQHRMMRGKDAGAKRGFWICGKPPLGYRSEGRQGKKVLVPTDNARYVRRMYELYADGESTRAIADWCEEQDNEDLPAYAAGVSNVLENKTYRGKIEWQEEEYDGQHAPIVGEDLWDEVQERKRVMAAKYRG